jgi:membrane-associated protein
LTNKPNLNNVSRLSNIHDAQEPWQENLLEIVLRLFDIILHVDKYLNIIIQDFGNWSYLILFIIVFCETGLVITPFLPGDSLLFAAGAFAAIGAFDMQAVIIVFAAAAIIGDNVNYWIGYKIGPKIFTKENVRMFNKKHLKRTHEFYERHGGKTVVLARFIPIIRTFMPFVAGIGRMRYLHFIVYDVIGGIIWPSIFVTAGFHFGNLPFVKRYFFVVVIAIIIISVAPILYGITRMRFNALDD